VGVPEDERNFSGIDRNLIEDVSAVAVQRLPRGIDAGSIICALPYAVVDCSSEKCGGWDP
jgi:hypothetical protein